MLNQWEQGIDQVAAIGSPCRIRTSLITSNIFRLSSCWESGLIISFYFSGLWICLGKLFDLVDTIYWVLMMFCYHILCFGSSDVTLSQLSPLRLNHHF